jgi:hypothetical protein
VRAAAWSAGTPASASGIGCWVFQAHSGFISPIPSISSIPTRYHSRLRQRHSHAKVVSHVIIAVLVGDRSVLLAAASIPWKGQQKESGGLSNPRTEWGVGVVLRSNEPDVPSRRARRTWRPRREEGMGGRTWLGERWWWGIEGRRMKEGTG